MTFEQFCAVTFVAHPIIMSILFPGFTSLYAFAKGDLGWAAACFLAALIYNTHPSCKCDKH